MNLPEWAKTTLFFLGLSICWDIVRTAVQIIWTSYLTRKLMRKDLEQVVEDVSDAVEEVIEENNGEQD